MALRDWFRRNYRSVPQDFVEGNRVELLVDGGPFFDAMLKAIGAAERYVFLESYIVVADETGWRVARALAQKAEHGVEVALSYDGFGSADLDGEFVAFLANAGVKLHVFRPVSFWKRSWPWTKRNHRKLLVVDGNVGLVGGMNISNDYAAPEDGGRGWRDTAICVQGPAVAELELMFRALWQREKAPPLTAVPAPAPRFADGHAARFLGNFARRDRGFVRKAYLLAILGAQRSVRICNAYFFPDRAIRRALVRAARRGVVVEIIVAGETDVKLALYAARALYQRLLKAGVKIYEWHSRVLHSKTAVIDGEWSTVGSSNLDPFSGFTNLEANAGVLGPRFGAQMEAQFDADKRVSTAVTPAMWHQRSFGVRVLEWIMFYWIRHRY